MKIYHWAWLGCFLVACCAATPARAQSPDLEKPLLNIDDDVSAFAYSSNGRIVYSVRRPVKTKKYDLQRDDIWLQEEGGKRRRLFQGDKFNRNNGLFSYTVESFRWSPNGRLFLAQLFATELVDESGKTQDSAMTLVFDESGKEMRINRRENVISDSVSGFWILDDSTVVYMTEAVKPHVLFSFRYVNLNTGPAGAAFEGRTFAAAEALPHSNAVIAVERDRGQSGPPRLQRLELLSQDDKELATLDGYGGGLCVSPSGKKVAYFIDNEVLEIREVGAPAKVARLRVGLGVMHWSADESRILLKRAPEKKSGDLAWFDVPPLAATPPGRTIPVSQPAPQIIFHGTGVRDFAISPDGRFLAVVAIGKRNLEVFPISVR
ncbi:MAG: hypothetical protein NVS9B4_24690 [Candidatus Acidiferrum sp.]